MFFVIAFSSSRLYGIQGSSKDMSSIQIARFLQSIKDWWDKSKIWWIICDNASIHVSKTINENLKYTKIPLITISPYSPCLNPWEVLISAIKAKIRKEIAKCKIIILQQQKNMLIKLTKVYKENMWMQAELKNSKR